MTETECSYCGGNCPNEPEDSEYLCDGFAGDIDNHENSEEHEHQWGPLEHSHFGGIVHRKCQVVGCKAVNILDDNDEEDSE